MRLTKRVGDLEAKAGDLDFAHLSDADLLNRVVICYQQIGQCGLILPDDWETRLRADPPVFMRDMQPQLDEMEKTICA
ncbi:MAG: hypothetical protein M0R03_18265 [Novosphingobium sp.]|nr:hypothetical protein [Novosphingobium sp.]